MKQLFVDTAGWMAMADAKDHMRASFRDVRDNWLEAGGTLVVSNYVVDETLMNGNKSDKTFVGKYCESWNRKLKMKLPAGLNAFRNGSKTAKWMGH